MAEEFFRNSQRISSKLQCYLNSSFDPNKSFFLGSLIGNQQRYEVKTLGPNSSALIIRDYQSNRDDGIYRCFATRLEGAIKEFRGFKAEAK